MADKKLSIKLSLNDKEFQSALRGVRKSLKKLPAQMQQTGKAMTRSLTLPLAALGAGAVKLASDFEETNAKFNTVFESMQGKANETAKNFQENFGLSSRAAKQLLGDTGDLLVGFGFQEEAALGLSDQVNKLAVDLASFTNFEGGAEGASKALTKALVGETEAAKALGIVIRQGTKEYKDRVAQIQKDQGVSILQAKALANLQIATEQSGKAIGDFARTSGSFANQSRILKGRLEDVGVELGTALLPIAMKALNGFQKLVGIIRNASPETKKIAVTIGIFAAALGPVISLLGSMAIAFTALTGPLGIVIGSIAALTGAFLYARENWDGLKERFSDISWWQNALIEMVQFVIKYNPFSALIEGYNALVELLGKDHLKADNLFMDLADSLDGLKTDTKDYEHDLTDLITSIKNQAKDAADAIGLIGTAMGVGTGGGGGETKDPWFAVPGSVAPIQAGPIATTGGSGPDLEMRTAVENVETFGEKFAEVMQSVQMIGQSVFTALGNASSLYFEQQNAQIDRTYEKEMLMAQQESDRKLLALEEDHAFSKIKEERRIQMLQNMTAAERQAFKIEQDYNKQREKLEQELADQEVAIQEEAAAEKRKIARKEAQVQKKLALLSATVNTAAAIVSALASVPPNVPLSIAVGIAGAAQIGTILATPLPALSDGGIAYGNTIAQVGEYSGASVNPEVIAPLDKLQSMMGGGTVKVVGEISGENIVLASERYNKRANRSF